MWRSGCMNSRAPSTCSTCRVDPSIVGGLIIRIGDRVIDRSVRARLSRLRQDVLEIEAST